MGRIIEGCEDIAIEFDCYLINPLDKDVDNLSKIPIDAIFFSAQNEVGYKTWECKISSLIVRKIKHEKNMLGITILGWP